jgi:ABC-type Na+ transport system ATPase subunit NatA
MLVENPKSARRCLALVGATLTESTGFRRSVDLARLMQCIVHRADRLLCEFQRGLDMTASTTFGQRVLAALAAFSMTTFLVVASFSTPSAFIVQGIVA